MHTISKKQKGSFFAEISATIAAISILTLIGTNYVDSQAGRAQVSEAFVLMQPLVEQVNNFYSQHGMLGLTGTNDANYDGIEVHTKSGGGESYAGRYVKEVKTYPNGVVSAKMNPQFLDSDATHDLVGKISNVQTAIQGEEIFLVPFLIGDTGSAEISGDASEHTNLRWACMTTIDTNPPTGDVIAPLNAGTNTIHEQYFYAPGCVVISADQAGCLKQDYDNCHTDTLYTKPMLWSVTLDHIVNTSD